LPPSSGREGHPAASQEPRPHFDAFDTVGSEKHERAMVTAKRRERSAAGRATGSRSFSPYL